MIALNPDFVATVDRAPNEVITEERRLMFEAAHPNEKFQPRFKKRGKSSSMRRYLRKQTHVIDANRVNAKFFISLKCGIFGINYLFLFIYIFLKTKKKIN